MADLPGFVGIGRMGGPMANRLLDAGYRPRSRSAPRPCS